MTTATAQIGSSAGGAVRLGSISRGRKSALRWSYFFLVLFVIFFLMPPVYMLITSLKTSAEIGAVTNPWWVYHPTLENYTTLLTQKTFLTFFRNSAVVSVLVVGSAKGVGQWSRDNRAPLETSPATIVTKRSDVHRGADGASVPATTRIGPRRRRSRFGIPC